jgi:hypothetical protein
MAITPTACDIMAAGTCPIPFEVVQMLPRLERQAIMPAE